MRTRLLILLATICVSGLSACGGGGSGDTGVTNQGGGYEPSQPDTTAPMIMLTGDASISINVGDTWSDPGYEADSGETVVLGGDTVNTAMVGTYTITYDATDAAGNAAAQGLRTVIVEPKGLLVAAKSDAELVASIRRGFTQLAVTLDSEQLIQLENDALVADAMPTARSASTFTTTYTLEASVDEHDYVKYDGRHIFIAPSRSMECCFIVDDVLPSDVAADAESQAFESREEERGIRIVKTDPDNAAASEVGHIALSGNRTVEGLYTHDSQLVAISTSGWWGAYGRDFSRSLNWQKQSTAVTVYDISDVNAPSQQVSIEVDGGFVNSRKKGHVVYLVVRHMPDIEGFVYYPNESQAVENNRLLENLSIDAVLPSVSINGTAAPLIDAQACYIADAENANAPSKLGYPTMTLLMAIDLTTQSIANTRCYSEPTDGLYVSDTTLYLSQVDRSGDVSRTYVHGYDLSESLAYVGSGVADGALYLSGNRDFRMNEHAGHLRVVTTQRTNDTRDRFDHQLSVLKIDESRLKMDVVATLPNAERPDAIGKPDEDLYGVRFFGDKLYLVTFERIDPLYVLDLSVPETPRIAGELEVTGFSDFLHPVNEQLLMGLGQDTEGLVKLELFNVASINAPYSLGTTSLGASDGAQWSYSEARYNRHAFTYQSFSDSVDRFLVPISLGLQSETGGYTDEDRLYLMEINGKDNSALAEIKEVGHIKAKREWWQGSRHRSIIHDDAVYFIRGDHIWSTLWGTPTTQNGPQ